MKIAKIKSWKLEIPLTRPYEIAFQKHESIDMVCVQIESDQGQTGFGTGTPNLLVTGESIDASMQAVDAISEQIVGDIRELPKYCRILPEISAPTPAARAAVDIALHDLFGKFLGIPVCRFLGLAVTKPLPTSITVGIMGVEQTLQEVQEYRDRGFWCLKIKIGNHFEEDCERLTKIRERFGSDVQIRVDPNQGYTVEQLQKFSQKTSHLDLELIEQPCSPNLDSEIKNLPLALRKQLACDESLHDAKKALTFTAEPRPFQCFNIKLMKSGGIYEALNIAKVAELGGFDLMWGCMDESEASISAALHAAFSSPATKFIDLDGSFDLAEDPFTGGHFVKEGFMHPSEQPGLGLKPR